MNMQAAPFSSERMDWETPPDLFNKLNEEFVFTLDVCAEQHNAKCQCWISPQRDALKRMWIGTCLMNPPYGRQIGAWIAHAAEQAKYGATVVALLPARTDTRYWHDYIWDGERHRPRPGVEVRFLRGRLRFVGAPAPAPFPSVIVVFRKPIAQAAG